jgi:hypothetical protein
MYWIFIRKIYQSLDEVFYLGRFVIQMIGPPAVSLHLWDFISSYPFRILLLQRRREKNTKTTVRLLLHLSLFYMLMSLFCTHFGDTVPLHCFNDDR